MSSLTSLYGGGGGGTPVNGIERLFVGGQTQYTDESGGVWLKTGNVLSSGLENYPDAYKDDPLSTATYAGISSPSIGAQSGSQWSFVFNNDGTKMFTTDYGSNRLLQYSLSTPYDITTITYANISTNVGVNEHYQPWAIAINNDGTRIYFGSGYNLAFFQYSLSTPYDLSTAFFSNSTPASQGPRSMKFNNDGTKLIALLADNKVYHYSLSVPYNIGGMLLISGNFSFSSQDGNAQAIVFNLNGTVMYMVGKTNDRIYKYNLSTAFDVSTITYSSESVSIASEDGEPRSLSFNEDYSKLLMLGANTSKIYEYQFNEVVGLSTDTGTYDYVKIK